MKAVAVAPRAPKHIITAMAWLRKCGQRRAMLESGESTKLELDIREGEGVELLCEDTDRYGGEDGVYRPGLIIVISSTY